MQMFKRSVGVPVAAVVLVLATLATRDVIGQRDAAPDACACVVTVNLPRVLEGLMERGEAETSLQRMAEQMKLEEESWIAKLEALRTRAQQSPELDPESRKQLSETFALESLNHQAWRAYTSEQLDIEKSLMLRELSRKIDAEIGELAAANGYDLVLVDDTARRLAINPESQLPREVQVKQQMTARRALYVSPSRDITDEVIARMNNAYNSPG